MRDARIKLRKQQRAFNELCSVAAESESFINAMVDVVTIIYFYYIQRKDLIGNTIK